MAPLQVGAGVCLRRERSEHLRTYISFPVAWKRFFIQLLESEKNLSSGKLTLGAAS